MNAKIISLTTIAIIVLAALSGPCAGWPTFRADPARTGYTDESLPSQLSIQWIRQSNHAPQPAWATEPRMPFDHAFHTVIADGTLVFGDSVECSINAIDAVTGKARWSYVTDGPIRFAPAVWQDRVFAVSDDGCLYCLSARDGQLLWKKRGAPETRMVLGNDRMISRWPARGGVAVLDGIVYYGAGIWQSEGIYLYALDAKTGEPVWTNETAGGMEMDQPHGGARAKSGVTSQGYLVLSGDHFILPTGRAIPAGFNRKTGEFLYYHLQKYSPSGGTRTAADSEHFFNLGYKETLEIFNLSDGERNAKLKATAIAISPEAVWLAGKGTIGKYTWVEVEKADKRGEKYKTKELQEVWKHEIKTAGTELIIAGNTLVSSGDRQVCLLNKETGDELCRFEVDGAPLGLAVADGKLYVSTDQGSIYCMGKEKPQQQIVHKKQLDTNSYGDNQKFAEAAEDSIRKTNVTEGFCLDLGCGAGELAYELAKRTDLQICAIDPDPKNVAEARKKLIAAGLYGTKVIVHQGDLSATGYPDYFADLIVSGRSVLEGAHAVPVLEMRRLQRPYGGMTYLGSAENAKVTSRDALSGAANWTHQYTNTANTCCSLDEIVKGPLEVLWFRDADQDMPQRHGRGPSPLFYNGRLYVMGLNALRCVDAYNGRTLWEYPFPGILKAYDQDHLMGTAGTGSVFCITPNGVYVHQDDLCYRIDSTTGELLDKFSAPPLPDGTPSTWGYIASVGDTLFGTVADTSHIVKWRYLQGDMSSQFTESKSLFAVDARTGKQKWVFHAEDSIRHNTIGIGDGLIYLIDRPLAVQDRIDYEKKKRRGESGKEEEVIPEHQTGTLYALDMETGDVVWKKESDIFGTLLAVSVPSDVLLMTYQPTRFRLDSEIGGRMAAYRASNGEKMWDIKAEYASRPLINGNLIYAQPSAWNLLTGEQTEFNFSRSYGCGTIAGSKNMMVFRSATLGYIDLTKGEETHNYGGVRAGCWINAIPAGGLLLVPDAVSGCVCSYQMHASVALQSR